MSAFGDLVSLGLSSVQTATLAYQAFHRTKVEELCKRLLATGVDMSIITNDDNNLGYFFSIVERMRREATLDKIEHWKNAMIHLITDFHDFDFKDSFLSTLEVLTAFDLTVLSEFYRINRNESNLGYQVDLLQFFEEKGVADDFIVHALRRLASHNLITELIQQPAGVTFELQRQIAPLRFAVNDLGRDFLRFVSEYQNQSSN